MWINYTEKTPRDLNMNTPYPDFYLECEKKMMPLNGQKV